MGKCYAKVGKEGIGTGRSEGGGLIIIRDNRPSNERGEEEDVRESVSPLCCLIRRGEKMLHTDDE